MGKLHRDNAGYIGCSHEETQDPYYSYNKLALPLNGDVSETVQRPAEVTHTVTVAGGKFVIGGVSQASLSLTEGGVYKFDQSDSSNGTHPFKFSQTSNGTWNRGTEYTKGVSYVGTPGSSGAYTQLVVPFGGLDLYYYCGIHTGIGGSASTPANAGMFTAALPILKTTDQFGATLGSGTNPDPFAANLVLAVPMNGSNNGTTFTDQSAAIKGSGSAKTITLYSGSSTGGAVTSTDQSNYYGSSFYVVRGGVNANASDYITRTGDTDLSFGTGDFTVEFWFYPTSLVSNYVMFDNRHPTTGWPSSSNGFSVYGNSSGTIHFYSGGSNVISADYAIQNQANQWHHFAVIRNNGHTSLLINGETKGSVVDSRDYNQDRFVLGSSAPNGEGTSGYFNDLRIYKGVAKYQPEGSGSLGMDVVTYTGNGGTQAISGLSFQPDLVYLATRTGTGYIKYVFDSVRGTTKALATSHTQGDDAETTVSNGLTAFNSNGFTLGGNAQINENGRSMVAWCWKAGGAASSNTDGTITSSVSVNTTYGFSICTYTGDGSGTANSDSGDSFGHGLFSAPKLILCKRRNSANGWPVYHASTALGALSFNGANALDTGSYLFAQQHPSSSVVYLGNNPEINATGSTYVAYCWSEVAGFSKFGTFTHTGGNQTLDFGFTPKFWLVKETDGTTPWYIFDAERDNFDNPLYPNNNSAEGSGFAFTFSGTTVSWIGGSFASGNYIYAAFAESAPGDPGPDAFKILETLNTQDQSSSAHTVTNNGASFQTSVQKFYGGAAALADGKYITVADSSELRVGTGDFTIEVWMHPTGYGSASYPSVISKYDDSDLSWILRLHSSGQLVWYNGANAGTNSASASGLSLLNQWSHIAVARQAGVTKIYLNGSQVLSVADTYNYDDSNPLVFGRQDLSNNNPFIGYLQDFRLYKGIAKYTSSFSPPERSIQGTARRYPSGVYVVS